MPAAFSLLAALDERGTRDLCLVGNTIPPGAQTLVGAGRVRHLIVSFTARAGGASPAEELMRKGEVTFELVPQGTLVERLRAAGAGLAAVYTPTGLGTPIAEGKEVRYFDGKPYLLETALSVDYAFIAGHRADRLGNVEFRGANQHFGPSFAKAAQVAIVEVDEVVEPGEIPPERIGLPGIFVSRVVRKTVASTLPKHGPARRGHDVPRTYNGKRAWTRRQMAELAASLLPEGAYVNLGLGIPSYLSSYAGGRPHPARRERDPRLRRDRSRRPDLPGRLQRERIPRHPGSWHLLLRQRDRLRDGAGRPGRRHRLGAYQVDAEGSFANWQTDSMIGGGIGGAMDLVASGRTVMVMMEHRDSRDRPKVVQRCNYALTGKSCVDILVTDLAQFRRKDGRLAVEQVAPGFTKEEVLALTDIDAATGTPAKAENP